MLIKSLLKPKRFNSLQTNLRRDEREKNSQSSLFFCPGSRWADRWRCYTMICPGESHSAHTQWHMAPGCQVYKTGLPGPRIIHLKLPAPLVTWTPALLWFCGYGGGFGMARVGGWCVSSRTGQLGIVPRLSDTAAQQIQPPPSPSWNKRGPREFL